ncbi:MAG: hypothetical protein WA733_14340 [Methylocystis sp.]
MFDAEHRLIAERLMRGARQGLRDTALIEAVRNEYPNVTSQAVMRAAFLAITRRDADKGAIQSIYEVGIFLFAKSTWPPFDN